MLPFDFTLVDAAHGYIWLIIFILLSFLISREIRGGRKYIGILLAATTIAAAWFVIPLWGQRWGLLAATILVIIIGKSDEIMRLSAKPQLIWQLIIATVLVVSGWTIPYVSHPLGSGILNLTLVEIGPLVLPADLLAIAWIVLMMNAVNWLDGMDGLAGGVSLITHTALAAVALLPAIQNGTTLGMAVIGSATLTAFLIWNIPPARVYLGTVGSWFVGMYIAIAASGGGGKIATALLILAIPVVDAAIVILRRLAAGQDISMGDTVNHIHHRLQRSGVGQRHVLAAAITVTSFLAVISVILTTQAKLIIALLGVSSVVVIGLRLWMGRRKLKSQYANTSAIYPR